MSGKFNTIIIKNSLVTANKYNKSKLISKFFGHSLASYQQLAVDDKLCTANFIISNLIVQQVAYTCQFRFTAVPLKYRQIFLIDKFATAPYGGQYNN